MTCKMKNKENFLALVSKEDTKTLEKNRWRINNRHWLRESQEIAMKILDKLDELNWSQKDLAEKMGVSPQHINKIVKGSENLTLDTITRLQKILNIPILANSNEDANNEIALKSMMETDAATAMACAKALKETPIRFGASKKPSKVAQ